MRRNQKNDGFIHTIMTRCSVDERVKSAVPCRAAPYGGGSEKRRCHVCPTATFVKGQLTRE